MDNTAIQQDMWSSSAFVLSRSVLQCTVLRTSTFRFFHFETTINLITEQKQCDNKLDRSCSRFLCSGRRFSFFLVALYCVLQSHFGFCLSLCTQIKSVKCVLIFQPTVYFLFNNRNQIFWDNDCRMHFWVMINYFGNALTMRKQVLWILRYSYHIPPSLSPGWQHRDTSLELCFGGLPIQIIQ